MMLSLMFFVVVTSLSVFSCSLSFRREESNSFLLEDGKLIADCFDKDPNECLSLLATHQSVNKLHLKEFVFDEEHMKQFSDTICQLQDLTLSQCEINDELASLLTFPRGLKSIRLERLNLSFNGIQSILDKLTPSLESLEVVDCLVSEFSKKKPLIKSSSSKASLNLSRFSHLKTISIDNLDENFNSCNFLLSLSSFPLERICLLYTSPSPRDRG